MVQNKTNKAYKMKSSGVIRGSRSRTMAGAANAAEIYNKGWQ